MMPWIKQWIRYLIKKMIMNVNELKPDFERIAYIFNYLESEKKYLYSDWEAIVKNELEYNLDYIKLSNLLKENKLDAYLNDLLFLAFRFKRMYKTWNPFQEDLKSIGKAHDEMLQALKFIINHPEMKIEFKYRHFSTLIQENKLISIIKKSLFDYFIENDLYFELEYLKPEEIANWEKFIEFHEYSGESVQYNPVESIQLIPEKSVQ
jgi:hypothetical protein